MLHQSEEEAAFLTAAGDAPRVGEQLELTALYEAEDLRRPSSQLPRFGRVVQLHDPQGTTRRVAIRFEGRLHPPSV